MKRVTLWSHVGTGLIVKCSSGVAYSNQTGGTCCLHPDQEGVFVPVGNDVAIPSGVLISKETALLAYFEGPPWSGTGAVTGLTEQDADFIDQLLEQSPNLSYISVDRSKLAGSHEAWVHVLVHAENIDPALATISGFGSYPLEAILTWSNSD